jgi:aminoglycoside 3-N-acetyltransferase
VHARADLADAFRALGVRPGDVVFLHASVRAVGPVVGGPDTIHLALKDALTADGTLMMYPSCPDGYDDLGRGVLTPDEEFHLRALLPPFDAATARSARDNGALVEMFRTWPGTVVNDHVARFAAWGAEAEHLFSEQPWDYAYGAGSALERFAWLGGRILLLGSDHDQVTFLHYAEHIADFPGKRVVRYRVPVLEDGARVLRECAEFDTADGAHAHWPDRFFARIVDAHLARTGNAGGRVGDARSYVIDARGLLSFAIEVMTAVARDRDAADALLG